MKFKHANEQSSGSGSKHFVKLKDKESVKGVFRGEPHDFKQHWIVDHSVICKGENCPECASGNKASFRFRINFVMKEGDQYVAKIFEQSFKVYEALRALHEGGYDLEKHGMQITRIGSGQQTNYSIMPIPGGVVSPAFEAQLSKVKLHDLVNPESESKNAIVEEFSEDDLPF